MTLLLALTLTFTAPPDSDLASYDVFSHVQSATWTAHAAAINADCQAGHADTLAAYWPAVRREADLNLVGTWAAKAPGQPDSILIANPCTSCWYGIVAKDVWGNASRMSNEVHW